MGKVNKTLSLTPETIKKLEELSLATLGEINLSMMVQILVNKEYKEQV